MNLVFKPTTATSKITKKPGRIDATSNRTTGSRPTGHTTSKETNAGEGEGTAVAGKAGDGGVSTATIVIPVTLVVLLVIVVAIFALWFKRRSASKYTILTGTGEGLLVGGWLMGLFNLNIIQFFWKFIVLTLLLT